MCEHCDTRALNPSHLVTNLFCVGCCAEMVRRARPSRKMQEKVFEAIETFRRLPMVTETLPTRDEILRVLKNEAKQVQQ